MPLPSLLTRYQGDIEAFLRSFLDRDGTPELYRMARYHMGWEDEEGRPAAQGGKALRPALCLLACEAVGGRWRRALPAAAALELVHNFSLIHDDVQDRDRERRHRPTVWRIWGEAQAINSGDALLVLARLALFRLQDEGVPQDTILGAARILDERTLEMVEGQVMDLGFERSLEVDLAACLEMIEKKTGALFDCSLRLGALVGGGKRAAVEAMGRCGRLLGIAFQVRDDVLGVWGAESSTGKEPAADIRRRKKSLPVVYAFAQAEGATLDLLRQAYGKPELSDEDVSVVLRSLDALDAQAYCRGLAQERGQAALAELEGVELSPGAARQLKKVAAFMLERDY